MPQLASVNVSAHGQRQYTRRSINALGCIFLSGDSGGIVMNVSEGGLAVYSAAIPNLEAMPYLRFQLPQSPEWIKARGKLAWSSETNHEAGIEFLELPDQARKQIREWITAQSCPPDSVESSLVVGRTQLAAISGVPADIATGTAGGARPALNAASDPLEVRLRAVFAQREEMLAREAASKKKMPFGRITVLCALAGVSLLLGLAAARGKLGPLVTPFNGTRDTASDPAPSVSEKSPDGTNKAASRAADYRNASAASSETHARAPRVTVTNQIYVPASHGSKARNLQIGRVNHRLDPEYPPQAISRGIEGSVQLRASISRAGAVQSVSVLGGPAMLTWPAVNAVRSWRYTPTLLDGKPIETEANIAIVFWLPEDSKANRPKD